MQPSPMMAGTARLCLGVALTQQLAQTQDAVAGEDCALPVGSMPNLIRRGRPRLALLRRPRPHDLMASPPFAIGQIRPSPLSPATCGRRKPLHRRAPPSSPGLFSLPAILVRAGDVLNIA